MISYLPFKPLFNLSNDLFDDDFGDTRSSGLNIYEEDNQVFVEAAVPGVKPENLKVTFEDGLLKISGEVKEEDVEKKGKRVVKQWSKSSKFYYSTFLHKPIDTKSMEAKIKDGIVTIKALVSEEAKPKEIKVKVE